MPQGHMDGPLDGESHGRQLLHPKSLFLQTEDILIACLIP